MKARNIISLFYPILLFFFFNLKSGIVEAKNARVFIFTDINIDAGDPDDRQSLVHLLWYANELKIEGIVPDRWSAGGLEACNLAVDAYEKDFHKYRLKKKNYPEPKEIRKLLAVDLDDA